MTTIQLTPQRQSIINQHTAAQILEQVVPCSEGIRATLTGGGFVKEGLTIALDGRGCRWHGQPEGGECVTENCPRAASTAGGVTQGGIDSPGRIILPQESVSHKSAGGLA